MRKSAVIKITDALDAEEVCKRLDVKPRSIRLARERGVFPARWYPTIIDMCNSAGIDCPMVAFNWGEEVAQ